MNTEQTKNTTAGILQWLADLVKWLLIIIAAGIIFYLVCPKYYYHADNHIRLNRITGKVEQIHPTGQ